MGNTKQILTFPQDSFIADRPMQTDKQFPQLLSMVSY